MVDSMRELSGLVRAVDHSRRYLESLRRVLVLGIVSLVMISGCGSGETVVAGSGATQEPLPTEGSGPALVIDGETSKNHNVRAGTMGELCWHRREVALAYLELGAHYITESYRREYSADQQEQSIVGPGTAPAPPQVRPAVPAPDPARAKQAVERWFETTSVAVERLRAIDTQQLPLAVRSFADTFQSDLQKAITLSERTLEKADLQDVSTEDALALYEALNKAANSDQLLMIEEYPGMDAYVAEAKASGLCPDL